MQLSLIPRKRRESRRRQSRGRRNDRVMIGHFLVLKHPSRRQHLRQVRRESGIDRRLCHRRKQPRQLRNEIPTQVTRVGTRIAQQLVRFIQTLRLAERVLRRPAKAPVARPLQRGQIEQQRRRLTKLFLLHRLDNRFSWGITLHQQVRQVSRRQSLVLAMLEERHERDTVWRLRISASQPRLYFKVIARNKAPNLLLALHHDPERRRLHPPERTEHAVCTSSPHRHRPRRIHPHQPVRLGATARRTRQIVELATRTQRRKTLGNRLLCERRNPQPLDRQSAAGQLVTESKDQLPFTTGIAGIDHRRKRATAQQFAHHLPLPQRGPNRSQLERLRQHRQSVDSPRLPRRVVLMWLAQLDQVTDTPRDHVALAGQRTIAAS